MRFIFKKTLFLGLGLYLAASAQAGGIRPVDEDGDARDKAPDGTGNGYFDPEAPKRSEPGSENNWATAGRPTATGYGVYYHGGPVMGGVTNIYYIWYGNWTGDNARTLLTNFAKNIGGSPYFNINTTYGTSSTAIVNSVKYAGAAMDNYSLGAVLGDGDIGAIVANAIGAAKLPNDPHGVYFVLTSKDVKETSGFCTQYCGWHTYETVNGNNVKFAFVGNPVSQCPRACSEQTTSPNNNEGADAMASVIAHELDESVTDPNLNAWYDGAGYENADKCAWTFGTVSTAANGGKYNVILGGTDYLIQQNWVNAQNGSRAGFCAMSH